MNVSEAPLPDSIADCIHDAALEGATLVGTAIDAEPRVIVDNVNRFLNECRRVHLHPDFDNWEDGAIPIGCLWGVAMARQFDWHWASVTQHDHGNNKAVALVSENRSLVIFPFHYCLGCLENEVIPTVLLAFNMLEAGAIPRQEAGGYTNLMDGVHHIVPPM